MQFVKNGPDVPERLLQRHEDGDVVFFCGAGISYPAGLPSFRGLAMDLFQNLDVTPNVVQDAAMRASSYDTAIGLLEADYPGGRPRVRREIAQILSNIESSPRVTETHEALLTLARTPDGRTHLVTTNFDRLFEKALSKKRANPPTHSAPYLPVPKRTRWDGLVYLHGLLPESESDSELERLVVSSGDFGLAYLTERWAARFAAELFREFTVCFVGYSLDDPVLRYMMDALAADKERGEAPREVFAFGGYKKSKREEAENEWNAKNVTPILYSAGKKHTHLHKTLKRWAETYRDGTRGKERIVLSEATGDPRNATSEDDFVKRILWAITDPSGIPARRFADQDPVPPLSWIGPLTEARYMDADLPRFKVEPDRGQESGVQFSVASRPAPYRLAPWMDLLMRGSAETHWDDVMTQLARWLKRHMGDPDLLLWITSHGGALHWQFSDILQRGLAEIEELEAKKDTQRIAEIKAGAPNAIPNRLLRAVWRIVFNEQVKHTGNNFQLIRWRQRWNRGELTPSLRIALRDILKPCVKFRKPLSLRSMEPETRDARSIKEIINWEITLPIEHPWSRFERIDAEEDWSREVGKCLPDFVVLLRDALELMRELGGIDERSDRSYIDRPSISEHSQNRNYEEWTFLIDLVREAWIAKSKEDVVEARNVAESWLRVPYPLFKRLAFFAASNNEVVDAQTAFQWLKKDNWWWLWSEETRRESLKLLRTIGPDLEGKDLREVEAAICEGPPEGVFGSEFDEGTWRMIRDRSVWLRLAKLAASGVKLGQTGEYELARLSRIHSTWEVADDNSDEFPFWMGDGDEFGTFVATPRRRAELVEWLRENPKADIWQEDDWQERCRHEFPRTAVALCALAQEGEWPVARWEEALRAWSTERTLVRSFRYMGPVIMSAPTDQWGPLANAVSWWLRELGAVVGSGVDLFLNYAGGC